MKTVSEEPNAVVWDCGYWVQHDAPECYANETHNLRRQLAQRDNRIAELEAEVERLKEFVADVRSIQPWREDDRGFISCIACGNEYAPHHSPICPFGRAWKEVEG